LYGHFHKQCVVISTNIVAISINTVTGRKGHVGIRHLDEENMTPPAKGLELIDECLGKMSDLGV
jgi:hypothetical protein